jgi:hypothetical protein
VITVSLDRALDEQAGGLDGQVRGEVHLHKTMELSCDGSQMIADRKNNLITSSFDIVDESKHYETCARIVMDYINRGYEITYLKLV